MEVTFNQKQNTEVFFLRSKNSTENPNMISEARQKFEIVFFVSKNKIHKKQQIFSEIMSRDSLNHQKMK